MLPAYARLLARFRNIRVLLRSNSLKKGTHWDFGSARPSDKLACMSTCANSVAAWPSQFRENDVSGLGLLPVTSDSFLLINYMFNYVRMRWAGKLMFYKSMILVIEREMGTKSPAGPAAISLG
jgi:hypothetical protein